mgnify:CR=1 FL=1
MHLVLTEDVCRKPRYRELGIYRHTICFRKIFRYILLPLFFVYAYYTTFMHFWQANCGKKVTNIRQKGAKTL